MRDWIFGANPIEPVGSSVSDGVSARIVDPATGVGLFNPNTDLDVTGVDPVTGDEAPSGTDIGFGGPVLDRIERGLYNGSFQIPPLDPDAPIISDTADAGYNPLRYWRLVQVSGSAVTASWADETVTLALNAGAAGDDGAFEQLHRINRSDYQRWAYVITGHVSASTTSSANAYLEGQFLDADLVATGSAVRDEADSGTFAVIMGATPSDAVYLRVRFGIERDALADSGTASRAWSEVNVHAAPDALYLSNTTERAASITATGATGYFRLRPDADAAPEVQVEAAVDVLSPVRVLNGAATVIAAMPVGLAPYAYPIGLPQDATSGGALNLDTVALGAGGARAIPILVPSLMLVDGCSIWSTDTASLRTAEWALYWDQGEGTTDNLVSVHDAFIGSAMGTFSFTPGAASVRTSTATGGPLRIAPGVYWLVIRNTSTARTFGVGFSSVGSLAVGHMRADTAQPSLTVTIDISGWTTSNGIMLARLNGRIGAESAGFV